VIISTENIQQQCFFIIYYENNYILFNKKIFTKKEIVENNPEFLEESNG